MKVQKIYVDSPSNDVDDDFPWSFGALFYAPQYTLDTHPPFDLRSNTRETLDAHLRKYVLHYFDENGWRNSTERSRLHIVIVTTCGLINSSTEIRSPVDWFGTPGIRAYLELARKPDRGDRQGDKQDPRCNSIDAPFDIPRFPSMLLSMFPDVPRYFFRDGRWHSRDKHCEISEICAMINSKGNELMADREIRRISICDKLRMNYYVYVYLEKIAHC